MKEHMDSKRPKYLSQQDPQILKYTKKQKKDSYRERTKLFEKNQTYTEKSPKNQEMLFSNCCQSATLDNTLNQKSECSTSLSGKKQFIFFTNSFHEHLKKKHQKFQNPVNMKERNRHRAT